MKWPTCRGSQVENIWWENWLSYIFPRFVYFKDNSKTPCLDAGFVTPHPSFFPCYEEKKNNPIVSSFKNKNSTKVWRNLCISRRRQYRELLASSISRLVVCTVCRLSFFCPLHVEGSSRIAKRFQLELLCSCQYWIKCGDLPSCRLEL